MEKEVGVAEGQRVAVYPVSMSSPEKEAGEGEGWARST